MADGWKVVTYAGKEYFYKQVTVVAGQNAGDGYTSTTANITNTLTKGKIKLQKFEAKADGTASTTPINGVKFGIYNHVACDAAIMASA